MPLKLTAPLYETFTLEKSDKRYGDPDDPTMVTIRQASQGDHEIRQSMFSTLEQKWKQLEPDEVTLVQRISMEELKKLEVYLCLVESNMTDEKDKLLFPSKDGADGNQRLALSKSKFMETWSLLNPFVANEIHEKVLKLNPLWSGNPSEGEE
jgi:hypothetical protein